MWVFFKILNFLLILLTGYFWMAFLIAPRIYLVGIDLLMIACIMMGDIKLQFSKRIPVLLMLLASMFFVTYFLRDAVEAQVMLFMYFPAMLIYMLPPDRQKDLIRSITVWLGVLLSISLAIYGLSLAVNLPSLGKFMPDALKNTYHPFTNYLFFIREDYSHMLYRFSGPFLEPGHLSLICVLVMFANKMDFKRQPWQWVLLACVLISMSLAGYILLIVGLVLLKLRNLPTAIGIAVIFGIAYVSVTQLWNNGDNPVNRMVFERLEYDKTRGIKGNNRTVVQTDKYFNQCVNDGTIILGVKNSTNKGEKIRGAGYKIFLLKYGVISLLIVGAYYLCLISPGANKRYALSFLIFIILIFLQRGYPQWYSWLFCFTAGIGATRSLSLIEDSQAET